MPSGSAALLAATATVGTTLAPWGIAFIKSYVVDKRLRPADIRFERIDVVTGAIMTGVIGITRDRELMGELVSSRLATLLAAVAMALIAVCVLTMLLSQVL